MKAGPLPAGSRRLSQCYSTIAETQNTQPEYEIEALKLFHDRKKPLQCCKRPLNAGIFLDISQSRL